MCWNIYQMLKWIEPRNILVRCSSQKLHGGRGAGEWRQEGEMKYQRLDLILTDLIEKGRRHLGAGGRALRRQRNESLRFSWVGVNCVWARLTVQSRSLTFWYLKWKNCGKLEWFLETRFEFVWVLCSDKKNIMFWTRFFPGQANSVTWF